MTKPKTSSAPVVDAYGNEWTGCRPVAESEIRSMAMRLERAIPDDVIAFLAAFNNGKPARQAFIDPVLDIETAMLQVIPVHPAKKIVMSLERYNTVLASRGDFPRDLFAFADDLGRANPFCVDLTTGGVVWWLHDDAKRPTRALTSTLGAFLSRLETTPW